MSYDPEPDPLQVNPYLFDDDGREHSPSTMRAIAVEMRSGLDAMLGRGERPNGNINQISTGSELSTAQIGQWSDAQALALTIGSSNAGRKFADVYQRFIEAFESVVEAIEANADNHDRARRENEG
ncbi:hypothetical protein ABGB18_32980 [Nonomuraea sp. B12E4]|uniref:hypothetical protein n=1 Tax=Nonomuraea sp. B12E4 TaxID=3153564 RepID=UPI00325EC0BC